MSKVTDKFKMTCVQIIGSGQAAEVIDIAQLMGFRWVEGQKPRDYPVVSPSWIMVDGNCRICNPPSHQNYAEFSQLTLADWIKAKYDFKLERTAKKKAQRAKKNPWHKSLGICPVNEGEYVDVKYRDGYIEYAIKALTSESRSSQNRVATCWHFIDADTDITHYRIVKKQPVQRFKVRTTKPDSKVSVGQLIDAFKAGKPVDVVVGPDTNPKKQFGDKSLPLNLWPALASAYGALGLYNGKLKYGANNFKATPVEASVYISAAKRHLEAWAEGEEFDPADGVPNLGGVLANIAILLEARAQGTLIDDRNLGTGYLKERGALKEIVGSLQVLHAGKTPKHYYKTEV